MHTNLKSLSENGYFGFMLRQAFQKNPHILRVCSGFFEKLSLPKTKISHFRTGSKQWTKSLIIMIMLAFNSNLLHAGENTGSKVQDARSLQSFVDNIRNSLGQGSGSSVPKTPDSNPPEITVPELFTNVLLETEDYKGWKVTGEGMGQLIVWTREGNRGARKDALSQAQKLESEKKPVRVLLETMTRHPIPLKEDTRPFFCWY
jgi:hypothetical protein